MSSTFESLLLLDDTLPLKLFDNWDPQTIALCRRVSHVLFGIVERYCSHRWNVYKLLDNYADPASKLARELWRWDAIVFGPAVFKFFARTTFPLEPLDICVGYRGIHAIVNILYEQGYEYHSLPGTPSTFKEAITYYTSRMATSKFTVGGERNPCLCDRHAKTFTFGRVIYYNDNLNFQKVTVHLVRSHPFQHIISLPSTALMNFINHSHAFSLFPRATFINNLSYVSRAGDLSNDPQSLSERSKACLAMHNIDCLGASPSPFNNGWGEFGLRYFGDASTWTIPNIHTGLIKVGSKMRIGPAFDVIHYRHSVASPESHIRIGEPGVWSIWSALKNQEIEKDPESDEEPFDVYMSRCTLNPYRL